jgi:hypothetical protein
MLIEEEEKDGGRKSGTMKSNNKSITVTLHEDHSVA